MRALLVKGLSTYDATRLFIDEAAAAFRRRGVEAVVVDVGEAENELDHLAALIEGQAFDLAFSIGLFGELRDGAGRDLGQVAGAPHVIQYVDYPLSHYQRLGATTASTALLVVDPTHVEAIRAVYGVERFKHVAFSPHGALGEPGPAEVDAEAFAGARPIPILFPASFYKPGVALWAGLDKATQKVFEAAVEIALTADFVPALNALDQAIERFGGHLREPLRSSLRLNAFAVHERVRQHRRFEMLKAVAKAGLPVHVYGSGYERDLYRFKNVRHQGSRPLAEIVEAMRQARIVLSINANFGMGSHERPLTAMVAGAVAATDESGFYRKAFAADEIVQLRWTNLAEDLEGLGTLLADPDAMSAIAAKGRARAVAGHRWDNRIDAILAAADAVRT